MGRSRTIGTYGDKGRRIVTASTFAQLKEYAGSDEPLSIRVDRRLKADPWGYEVPVKSDKTIIGVGKFPRTTMGNVRTGMAFRLIHPRKSGLITARSEGGDVSLGSS
ncbi:hypothetical protein VTO42DRAFT_872 [Malbranchea cinnamomea]